MADRKQGYKTIDEYIALFHTDIQEIHPIRTGEKDGGIQGKRESGKRQKKKITQQGNID